MIRLRSPAFRWELVNMAVNTKRLSIPRHVCWESSVEFEPVSEKPAFVYGRVRHRDFPSSTFLRPFAPRALPRFHASMDALTPERPALLTGRLNVSPAHEHRPARPGLLALWIEPSDHSVSNHPPSSRGSEFGLIPRAYRRVSAPASRTHSGRVPHGVSWASPFPSRLATTTGRIEFVILRTSRSPPVAPHPASRRRSYVRLQSSNPNLDRDSHPVDSIHSQAH